MGGDKGGVRVVPKPPVSRPQPPPALLPVPTSSWLISSMVPLERGSLMSCILQACSRLWRSLRFCSSFVSMAVTSFCRCVISLGGGGREGGRQARLATPTSPAHRAQAPPVHP